MYHLHPITPYPQSKRSSSNSFKLKRKRRRTKPLRRNYPRKLKSKLKMSLWNRRNTTKVNLLGKNPGSRDKSLTSVYLSAVRRQSSYFKSVWQSELSFCHLLEISAVVRSKKTPLELFCRLYKII